MSVQKLLGSNFKNIKTGATTVDDLDKKILKDTYKYLLSQYKNQENDNILWIGKRKAAIKKFMMAKYNNGPWKSTTLKIRLEALANILLAIDKKKYRNYAKQIFLYTRELQIKYRTNKKEQMMTDREKNNFVSFDEVQRQFDIHYKKWQEDPHDKKNHMKMFILAVNSLIPPLRLDYLRMKYRDTPEKPERDRINYIWKNNGKYIMLIYHDKIEHKKREYGADTHEIDLSKDYTSKNTNTIFINGTMISNIFDKSFSVWERSFVLPSYKNPSQVMSVSTYNSLLKEIFGKNVTQSILRKSYINHYYDQSMQLNLNEKEIIAKYMRHSMRTANENYNKIDAKENLKGDMG